MKATFEKVRPLLFAHEGGYTDHRGDPGNWSEGKVGRGRLIGTNFGIAAPTLIGWRGGNVTAADMKALTRDEAIQIYKAQYWDTIRADELPAGVDYCCYDYSVNSGPGRASKELQRVVGAKVDGVIGPMTLAALKISGLSSATIIDQICNRRLAFMKRLKTWKTFGKGWSRRVGDVRTKSKQFAMNYPVADHVAGDAPIPKAKPEDKSPFTAWKTPQGVATGVTALTGAGGFLSGTGPVQWGLAFIFVVAALVGAYFFIKRMQEDD
ncbi:glycoside hydrolase family 108 protein [Roseibium sp.]|uniref:glycoside hydrolase family 108 protein n=1 Tax=Roseibium sp. TaxID=1936156 RepID=UPI003B52FE39